MQIGTSLKSASVYVNKYISCYKKDLIKSDSDNVFDSWSEKENTTKCA